MLSAVLAAGSSSAGEDWKLVAPLIAAAIALIGVLIALVVNGRRAERERLRGLYADGWAAVQAYKEMAFAIRRRNAEDRAVERVRLFARVGPRSAQRGAGGSSGLADADAPVGFTCDEQLFGRGSPPRIRSSR